MSKLPKDRQFLDLSDYGRPVARWIANVLKSTFVTPVHVTYVFILAGLFATYCILQQQYILALIFLIVKSTLDAADGELSRVKNSPSYTGRYLDSIADIILNFIFLGAICYMTESSLVIFILAFIGMQLQGTLYNYYYVILRNHANGDTTSRIIESTTPLAMKGEKQSTVNFLFTLYTALYFVFDKTIYYLDRGAMHSTQFPTWFMTLLSTFGLGFQLLIMGVMMAFGGIDYVLLYFIISSLFILIFIAIRRMINT